MSADRNFVVQQGLAAPEVAACFRNSAALRFQPRIVGLLALVGTIGRWPAVFGALALLLWWCSLVPSANPFEFVYNRTLGRRPGAMRLAAAPAPRRFAQGMAGTIAAAICVAMLAGSGVAAGVLQGLLLLAVAALAFGRFCLGSFLFHLLRGRVAFALATLPWGRGT